MDLFTPCERGISYVSLSSSWKGKKIQGPYCVLSRWLRLFADSLFRADIITKNTSLSYSAYLLESK